MRIQEVNQVLLEAGLEYKPNTLENALRLKGVKPSRIGNMRVRKGIRLKTSTDTNPKVLEELPTEKKVIFDKHNSSLDKKSFVFEPREEAPVDNYPYELDEGVIEDLGYPSWDMPKNTKWFTGKQQLVIREGILDNKSHTTILYDIQKCEDLGSDKSYCLSDPNLSVNEVKKKKRTFVKRIKDYALKYKSTFDYHNELRKRKRFEKKQRN